MRSFFSHLRGSLKRTRDGFTGSLKSLISTRRSLSDELLENIEETLILGDIGVETTAEIIDEIKARYHREKAVGYGEVIAAVKSIVYDELNPIISASNGDVRNPSPLVILVTGVNGTGKTTSIGKLAYYYKSQGKRVLLAAADTFRAAAVDQLDIWKERTGADIVKNIAGTDPAAVAYDSAHAALARSVDVLLIDTAGRIHTNANLMEELKKVSRVVGTIIPGAPHKTLLVIDAHMGQNAISQAKMFSNALNISGIILAKLDGTAKGGAVVPIMKNLKIPIEFIGTGEQKEDIQKFDLDEYMNALFA